jgi:hypothetical protein
MSVVVGDPGPLVLNIDVDDAIIGVLRDSNWMNTYLRVTAEERNETVPAYPNGGSYNNPVEMSEWTDQMFPAVLVATVKTDGAAIRQRDGNYSIKWRATVSAVVRGTKAQETRHRAALYEGAVRRALGHRNVWSNGLVHAAYWQATEIRPISTGSAGRYLAAGMATFLVMTDAVFSDSPGLPVPDPPGGIGPDVVPSATIQPFVVDVEGLSPNEDLGG